MSYAVITTNGRKVLTTEQHTAKETRKYLNTLHKNNEVFKTYQIGNTTLLILLKESKK